jgi:sterol desaturase/sphingolipid hydroxylase (fatty acid hydroxylase superfamily)
MLTDAGRTLFGLLSGIAIFRVIEMTFPREGAQPERPLGGIRIWLVYIGLQVVLTASVMTLVDVSGAPQVDPSGMFGLPWWGVIPLVAIGFAVVQDFFFYWGHRIQHRWLWRWHAPHHAIRNMTAANSWHHWSEILMHALLVSLPMSLLSPAFGPRPFLIGVLLSWQPIYLHSATRLQLGPFLRRIIIDGRFHRIHHSLEPRHFDRNFGAVTPLWDWLFKTAYFPGKDEWPDVGVAGIEDPRTIREWSMMPWRSRGRLEAFPPETIQGQDPVAAKQHASAA